jgi:hypothetical protein
MFIPRGCVMTVRQVAALSAMLVMVLTVAGVVACTEKTPERRLSRAVLEDKVRGGWAGQMIGVAYGGPTEFQSNGKILEREIEWSPEMVGSTIDQDDLYVEMTFAEVMDTVGLDATTEQYGEMFRDSEYRLWHANAGARRNLNRGIKAPMSGHPMYNVHANDIDFQIESDFIGLMTPGLPQEANRYADRVGRVMNYGDGLYGGMFVGGMYAVGFFETDPRKVVEEGLKSIPAGSGYAQVISDVLTWHAEHPKDWKTAWALLEEKWDGDDMCPEGAGKPFNIDARLNGAYIALGLLYGEGDLARTLEISTRSGQDSDCNPSSAAGILGVMLGYEAIPDEFKSGIPAIEDEKFSYTQYSFNDIVASTIKRAETIIEGAGGRVTDAEVIIPLQTPVAPPLEQWEADPPIRRLELDDPAWEWTGAWSLQTFEHPWGDWKAMLTTEAGAEAAFVFEGTGVAILGDMTQEGGRADVFLDGTKSDYTLDAWIPERTNDIDYWHVTGLEPGEHTIRVVVRDDADQRSEGRVVRIRSAVVYGKRVQ